MKLFVTLFERFSLQNDADLDIEEDVEGGVDEDGSLGSWLVSWFSTGTWVEGQDTITIGDTHT